MNSLKIMIDDLSTPAIIDFLNDHLMHMMTTSPPGSVHALDIDALKKPEVTFWGVWNEKSQLVGCGALKELDGHHAELKSMRTAPSKRGKGIASVLLKHILAEAKRRGYQRISLETGAYEAFKPARQLYSKFGFSYCGPFADYKLDPYSVFMMIKP